MDSLRPVLRNNDFKITSELNTPSFRISKIKAVERLFTKQREFDHLRFLLNFLSLVFLAVNPFIPNAPFLYPLKTSENAKVF